MAVLRKVRVRCVLRQYYCFAPSVLSRTSAKVRIRLHLTSTHEHEHAALLLREAFETHHGYEQGGQKPNNGQTAAAAPLTGLRKEVATAKPNV